MTTSDLTSRRTPEFDGSSMTKCSSLGQIESMTTMNPWLLQKEEKLNPMKRLRGILEGVTKLATNATPPDIVEELTLGPESASNSRSKKLT